MVIRDEYTGREMHEIHTSLPPIPKCRRPLRPKGTEENYSLKNNFQRLQMERQRNRSNLSKSEESFRDQSTNYNASVPESSSDESEETESPYSQNYSSTTSSETDLPKKDTIGLSKDKQQNTSRCSYFICPIIVIGILLAVYNKVQTQSISKPTSRLSESIEKIKAIFYHQESDIWNDISSEINEVMSRTPKIPSIILLFAKETTTMNCLATKLAYMSSTILHGDNYLVFNPEDFGNDAGEIITTLNEHSPEKKKVVIIHDILNIDAEAIKALHNLCDRINPLIGEAIYILTMQTNNYQSQQKKLSFVEKQIYNKLSKSIDQDVLMALVTRITDGAIISVQPEPQLRYC